MYSTLRRRVQKVAVGGYFSTSTEILHISAWLASNLGSPATGVEGLSWIPIKLCQFVKYENGKYIKCIKLCQFVKCKYMENTKRFWCILHRRRGAKGRTLRKWKVGGFEWGLNFSCIFSPNIVIEVNEVFRFVEQSRACWWNIQGMVQLFTEPTELT